MISTESNIRGCRFRATEWRRVRTDEAALITFSRLRGGDDGVPPRSLRVGYLLTASLYAKSGEGTVMRGAVAVAVYIERNNGEWGTELSSACRVRGPMLPWP